MSLANYYKKVSINIRSASCIRTCPISSARIKDLFYSFIEVIDKYSDTDDIETKLPMPYYSLFKPKAVSKLVEMSDLVKDGKGTTTFYYIFLLNIAFYDSFYRSVRVVDSLRTSTGGVGIPLDVTFVGWDRTNLEKVKLLITIMDKEVSDLLNANLAPNEEHYVATCIKRILDLNE